MAAGTGGHVYPALAVAERLRDRGVEVMWLGTKSGIESRLVPAAGFPFHILQVAGLRGKNLRRRLAAPFLLLRSGLQALSLLMRLRPHVVLGMGGYGAGPGGIASRLLRIPLVIHEQNAAPGLTNRLLAPIAGRVLEAFPGSFAPRRRAIHTGNPVREELLRMRLSKAKAEFENRPVLRLLVLGGSQGAKSLNEAVPMAISRLRGSPIPGEAEPRPPALEATRRPAIEIVHQCGAAHIDATRRGYRACGLEAQVSGYIEDMPAAYSRADLVICRAGAMTVAELAVMGVASILVIGTIPLEGGEVSVIDDYAHHPREIEATVDAVRAGWPERRLVVFFQPHRYTRTRDLFDDFAAVLSNLEMLIVLEVYAAGESPIRAADGRALCRAIRARGRVDPVFAPQVADACALAPDLVCPGDIVLTLGAGDISAAPVRIIEALEASKPNAASPSPSSSSSSIERGSNP
eukprot:XP_003389651.2 PREDICTED: uncharacterized protein LOC100641310 [Amphimedon queenslandica]